MKLITFRRRLEPYHFMYEVLVFEAGKTGGLVGEHLGFVLEQGELLCDSLMGLQYGAEEKGIRDTLEVIMSQQDLNNQHRGQFDPLATERQIRGKYPTARYLLAARFMFRKIGEIPEGAVILNWTSESMISALRRMLKTRLRPVKEEYPRGTYGRSRFDLAEEADAIRAGIADAGLPERSRPGITLAESRLLERMIDPPPDRGLRIRISADGPGQSVDNQQDRSQRVRGEEGSGVQRDTSVGIEALTALIRISRESTGRVREAFEALSESASWSGVALEDFARVSGEISEAVNRRLEEMDGEAFDLEEETEERDRKSKPTFSGDFDLRDEEARRPPSRSGAIEIDPGESGEGS